MTLFPAANACMIASPGAVSSTVHKNCIILTLANLLCMFVAAGECNTLEKQLSEVQASEASLSKAKAALEMKLTELEELLATTTSSRDELTGGHVCLHLVRAAALLGVNRRELLHVA
jgi:hypothetical protein